ncbi:EB domain-containing protein [Caerostris extrusa]|uniref:EB domain-containing protein n=1 Tax=Caerostris extrusa TaxID=172846 RepID=A0AAV4P5C0_CAEEX|nr:EB domain-containing protein [Caerostris extrusa]
MRGNVDVLYVEETCYAKSSAILGDSCEYDDACVYVDDNTACVGGKCGCANGFQAAQHMKGPAICLPASTVTFLENNYLMTTISAVAGLIIFYSSSLPRAQVIQQGSLQPSRGPHGQRRLPSDHDVRVHGQPRPGLPEGLPQQHEQHRLPARLQEGQLPSMLAPPSSLGSRRPSTTSVRSGLSFRTNSSFRGYRFTREPVREDALLPRGLLAKLPRALQGAQPPAAPPPPPPHRAPQQPRRRGRHPGRFSGSNGECKSSKQSYIDGE